jgi:AraC-like DNA-binding protein
MKPTFEAISASQNASFSVRRFEEPRFSAPYHFHPEYELTLIVAGSGNRYVGTHMGDYGPGDLVLLGANLPHCWKTEEVPLHPSASVVIQFHEQFMGTPFFDKPELASIRQLLQASRYGLQFTGDTSVVKTAMLELAGEQEPFKRLQSLLHILHTLAGTTNHTVLEKRSEYTNLSVTEKERINAVMGYIVDNFQNTIRLSDVAAIANMTPHAFCKYFKRITRKTVVEAVNDYRIDFAARQLVYTGKAVSQIGFDSGFEDVSNFYKTFRRRMKRSPLSYRNAFIKKLV